MIINLTPHAMHIYPPGTPDEIEPGTVQPVHIIEPSANLGPARLGHAVAITDEDVDPDTGIRVDLVVFGAERGPIGLPPVVDGTCYLVSLVVGLAAVGRHDLLVPHEYVRDLGGRIIGSRKLARPYRG
jgi:hypothetical protein